jgi:hypothetical protein
MTLEKIFKNLILAELSLFVLRGEKSQGSLWLFAIKWD